MYNPGYERQMLQYFTNSGSDANAFPTFSAFAEEIGVSLAEISEWKRSEPSFARAWEECRERQRTRLIVGALTRRYDPSFCKFLLGEISPERSAEPFTVRVEVVE